MGFLDNGEPGNPRKLTSDGQQGKIPGFTYGYAEKMKYPGSPPIL
jgi:hypothetical protein